MKQDFLFIFLFTCSLFAIGQPSFNKSHGLYKTNFIIKITPSLEGSEIRYTTDCSEPTMKSELYTVGLNIKGTTILRAAEFIDGEMVTPISTVSYIFPQNVLSQPNNPEGYPATWGKFTTMNGTAVADYEMDPEMTGNKTLSKKIQQAFYSLPVLSLVSDKGNFFNPEKNEKTGGIYMYTGTSDSNGRGWERPVSVELFGGNENHDLSVNCAIKLHGGQGRVPEKNPKHSFRLTFKEEYGPSKLKYPVYGEDCVSHFNSLIVRTFYNYSWTHTDGGQRSKAQYERDLWCRRMQMRMGYCTSDGIYVHVFLNGMYWGLYNLAERIDDFYCKQHGGGKKEDYDVVKREDYLEAAEGTLDKWNEMVSLSEKAADHKYYQMMIGEKPISDTKDPEVFIDIDNFIDYMLINQYGGNADWDQHNWIAFCNRNNLSEGFRFICWDSEQTNRDVNQNSLGINNKSCPTYIFNNLMKNRTFLHRYMDRAYKHLSNGGLLTEDKTVELWDSLYNCISEAVYDEAARWGDYRRDVHPYSSKGELYTVDNHYMTERSRLLDKYFPYRTANFKNSLISKGWYPKVEAPVLLINGKENASCDTLTWDDEVMLSNGSVIVYTIDGTCPISWESSANGTVKGNVYQKENIMEKLNGATGWITLRYACKSTIGWSATVDRKFYISNGTGIFDIAEQKTAGEQTSTYNLLGQKVNNTLIKGIYIKNGKKIFVR